MCVKEMERGGGGGGGGGGKRRRRRQDIHVVHSVPPFSLSCSQHLDLQQKAGGKRGHGLGRVLFPSLLGILLEPEYSSVEVLPHKCRIIGNLSTCLIFARFLY
jgi:hypothetical protein